MAKSKEAAEAVKFSLFLSPDVHHALRMAAATDAMSMTQKAQSLLRDLLLPAKKKPVQMANAVSQACAQSHR